MPRPLQSTAHLRDKNLCQSGDKAQQKYTVYQTLTAPKSTLTILKSSLTIPKSSLVAFKSSRIGFNALLSIRSISSAVLRSSPSAVRALSAEHCRTRVLGRLQCVFAERDKDLESLQPP